MYEYLDEEVRKELEQEGYTPEDIEEYIRQEVNKDKNKKYKEMDEVKLTYVIFLLGLVSTEDFIKKIDKIIKKPNRDYTQIRKMINEINPEHTTRIFKEPKAKDIEKMKFDITSAKELKARERYIKIISRYYDKSLKTLNKEYINKTEYLIKKVSKFDKIEKVVPYYDKKGRIVAYHDIASYNSMVYNTNLTSAVWNETLDNAIKTKNDLVYVPGHWGSCPNCAPYEDRIYSITGANGMYPTLDEAIEGGLKHPNCKHPIENYNSEVLTSESVSTPPEVYDTLQKINALELKRDRLKVDRKAYKYIAKTEGEGYDEIDKVNSQIKKINKAIREQKSILEQYK